MASSKHWALYAANHHLGTTRVHRLAGARLGRFSVNIDYNAMHGWKFTIHWRPFHIEFGMAAGEAIRKRWFDEVLFRHPQFAEGIKASIKSGDEGRGYRMNTEDDRAPMEPLATWRADDPEAPEGWHHDGEKWVQDEEGWSRDRSGYWRFTKPGDFGWVMRKDRWEYLELSPEGMRHGN